MMAIAGWGAFLRWSRSSVSSSSAFLKALVVATPLGVIAIESGWVVTEVGRQPWIIQGVLKTADAVTPMPGLVLPLILFTFIYVFLAVIVSLNVTVTGALTATLVEPLAGSKLVIVGAVVSAPEPEASKV